MRSHGGPHCGRALVVVAIAAAVVGLAAGGWLARWRQAGVATVSAPGPGPVSGPRSAARDVEIIFSLDAEGKVKGGGFLPAGKTPVYGTCELGPEVEMREVSAGWSWNGGVTQPVAVETVGEGKSGGKPVRLSMAQEKGFGPGVGEAEIHWRGRRVARGSFVIAADAAEIAGQQVPAAARTGVAWVKTARGVDDKGDPKDETRRFTANQRVWVSFAYRGATKGAAFTVQWSREEADSAVMETTVTAQEEEGKGTAWIQVPEGAGLPEGKYKVRVIYGTGGAPLGETAFEVVSQEGGAEGTESGSAGVKAGAAPRSGAGPGQSPGGRGGAQEAGGSK